MAMLYSQAAVTLVCLMQDGLQKNLATLSLLHSSEIQLEAVDYSIVYIKSHHFS